MAEFTSKCVDIQFGRGRRRSDHMGRFGGGWQWAVGFQTGSWSRRTGGTIIINLLVTSWRIQIKGRGA